MLGVIYLGGTYLAGSGIGVCVEEKSASESLSVVAAEGSGALTAALARTDTVSVAVTETAAVLATWARADVAAVTASETRVLLGVLASSETGLVALVEGAVGLSGTLARSDTASVSVLAAGAPMTVVGVSDTVAVGSLETVASERVVAVSEDACALTLEMTDLPLVSTSAVETASVAAMTASTVMVASATAEGIFLTSDGYLDLLGLRATTADAEVALTMAQSLVVSVTRADTLDVAVPDTSSDVTAAVRATDAATSAVSEAATAISSVAGVDALGLAVASQVALSVTVASGDTVFPAAVDARALLGHVTGTDNEAVTVGETAETAEPKAVADVVSVLADDGAGIVGVLSHRTEQTTVDLVEARILRVTLASTDAIGISVSETSGFSRQAGTPVCDIAAPIARTRLGMYAGTPFLTVTAPTTTHAVGGVSRYGGTPIAYTLAPAATQDARYYFSPGTPVLQFTIPDARLGEIQVTIFWKSISFSYARANNEVLTLEHFENEVFKSASDIGVARD